jgi:outer membrane protein assembly factor BamB
MYNLARARAVGHLLVVVTPPNLIVIDTLRNAVDSQENVLWRADLAEGLPNAQRRLGQRTLRDPWQQSGVRPVVTDASPQRVPLTTSVVVTASGLCYMKYRQLICADPLTGEALWVRDGLDAGMQLYGDDRYLFVVGYDQTEAMVLDTATGEFLGKRPAERMENRWATWGTHVLAWREESNKLLLRLYDAWQQRELWRCEFAQGARGTLVGSDEVAVFDPSGLFVVVSIRQGRELWRTRLEPVVAPTTLFVQRTPEAYFVMPGSALPPNVRAPNISFGSGGIQVPVVRGYLYALDRRSGQSLWPAPAYLDGYAIPVQQPAQLPVLCFARGIPQTNNTRATRIVAALAVLDKRDGRLLYGREDLPLVQPNVLTLETQGNPEQGKVEVLFAGHKVALQWTDDPIPPAPPEQGGGISGETGQ